MPGSSIGTQGAARDYTLAPAQRIVVFTESEHASAEEQAVSLHWSGVPELTAWWNYSLAETAARVSVVNTNLAFENPFYSVPLYQEIYYRGEEGKILQNLRVRTTTPGN